MLLYAGFDSLSAYAADVCTDAHRLLTLSAQPEAVHTGKFRPLRILKSEKRQPFQALQRAVSVITSAMEKLRRGIVVLGAMLSLCTVLACAQTSLATSVYGAYRSSTQVTGTDSVSTESPSNAVGVSIELRHIRSPLVGYDVTYSYHPMSENYQYFTPTHVCSSDPTSSAQTCSLELEASLPENAHVITGDWAFSFKHGKLRPFALVGGGLLIDVPASSNVAVSSALTQCISGKPNPTCTITLDSSTSPVRTQMKGVFEYGVGLDWAIRRHLGLRFQYRGDVYKAAALINGFPPIDKFAQDFRPEAGIFFRF